MKDGTAGILLLVALLLLVSTAAAAAKGNRPAFARATTSGRGRGILCSPRVCKAATGRACIWLVAEGGGACSAC